VLFSVVQHFGQDLLSAIGLGFTDRGSKDGNEIFHLRFGQQGKTGSKWITNFMKGFLAYASWCFKLKLMRGRLLGNT